MTRYILLLAISVFLGLEVHAQGYFWQSVGKTNRLKNLTVDGGIGLRMYTGDIQQKGALFNPLKFAYGLGARYQFGSRFGAEFHFAGRGYRGKSEQGGFPDAVSEATGQLWEGALMIQYSILRWEDFTVRTFTDRDPVTKMNIYIGAGGGGALFNGSFSSRVYQTQVFQDSLGQDSSVSIAVEQSGSGGGFGFFVPVVFGARYRFSPRLSMSFQIQQHIYFSDNLEGLERQNNDGMTLAMLKLGYTFGQRKSAAQMGKTPRQLKKGR